MRKPAEFKLVAIVLSIFVLLFALMGAISNAEEEKSDQYEPYKIIILPGCGISTGVKEDELCDRLAKIHGQSKGTDFENLEKLETECLRLLKEYDSPEHKGKIYATIAFIYSESGFWIKNIQLPKTIEYCKKALQYPLAPLTACAIYGKWTDALMCRYWSYPKEEFVKRRREATVLCLTGLKLALDNNAPKEMPEGPPMVSKYECPTDSPEYQEILREHEEQLRARRRWEIETELYFQRGALTQRCVSLYTHEPYATDELRRLAGEILKGYDAVVEEILTEVEAKIGR